MDTALAICEGPDTSALVPSMDDWFDAVLADPAAAEQLAQNARTHSETKEGRHARKTRKNYDFWWSRFETWCTTPSERIRGRALPPSTPAMALDPSDPRGMQLLLIWLYEMVYGPEDSGAKKVWDEEFGPVAPNTLSMAMSALKARCKDRLGHRISLTSEVEDALMGLRRVAREAYGRDRRATPLLASHLVRMARWLARADDPLVARDRLLVELAGAGVSPGEITRLTMDCLREPADDLVALTHEANFRLWEETGAVGARTLVVPGRQLGGGRRGRSRIITMLAGCPLASAIDAWLPHRTSGDDQSLIDGVGTSNPRSIHRLSLKALAEGARDQGCTWTPGRAEPVPDQGSLDAMRRTLVLRSAGDLALRQRDTAALWIGWRIALRRSELVALTVGDLDCHPDRVLVTIQRSKTDQAGEGRTLPLVAGTRTDGLNPVEDIRSWLTTLARIHGYDQWSDLPRSTPLFPALARGSEILVRQVALADGTIEIRRYDAMSAQGWSERLRVLAERSGAITDAAGLARVTGHSLRRGYITSSAMAGRTAIEIQRISRHVDLNSLARYVEQVQTQWGDDIDDFELLVPDAGDTVTKPKQTLDARLAGARA